MKKNKKGNNNLKKLIMQNIKPIIIAVLSILILFIASFKIGIVLSALIVLIIDLILYFLLNKNSKKTSPKEKLKTFLIVCFGCAAILLILFLVFLGFIMVTAPKFDPEALYSKGASVLVDKNGEEYAKIGGAEIRENVDYEDLSQSLIDAILATEDSRFFQHSGVDLPRFLKASVQQLLGRGGGGASTLTMQLSKKNYTSTEAHGIQGIIRKFSDVYMAVFKIETHYTKEQIFEFYVNSNYLGASVYGVQLASRTYFNKDVSELNIAEAAMIAGMFQAPDGYDPYKHPEACESRRKTVLSLMLRHGYISKEEYDIASKLTVDKIVVNKKSNNNEYLAFIETVVDEVIERTGNDPYQVPMKIYTTMDRTMQDNMNSVFNGTKFKWKNDYIQAASIVLDVNDGSIQAVGAGRNRVARGTNLATEIKRQIGSTAKPLYDYGPAMEYNGASTYTIFSDEPYTYSTGMALKNFDGDFDGARTLHYSLQDSRNIPAVKAFQSVKNSNIKTFVTNLGLSPEIDEQGNLHESHALGGYTGESPLTMAAAYAAFSNGGYYNEPHSFTKIEYLNSNNTYTVKPITRKAMSDSTAYMITKVLEDTGKTAIARNVNGVNYCGKTGTTNLTNATIKEMHYPNNAIRDRWIMSYNDTYAISLWYGYEELMKDYYLTMAMYEHKDLFKAIAEGVYTKNSSWSQPSSVVKAEVESELPEAMLASEFTPEGSDLSGYKLKYTEYFKKGTEPTEVSTRFSKLPDVTNLKYENGIISWDAIKTPDFINQNYINDLFNKLFTNEGKKNEEINKRINYNNTHIGNIVYEIYSKDTNGNLTLLATTSDTKYEYFTSGNIVVKTAYSIFKDNKSDGASLTVESNIITSELTTPDIIDLNIGDNYIEPEKPVVVLQNGNVDITNDANISISITKKSDNTVSDKIYYITTITEEVYIVKYTITYGNYSNTLTKTINVKKTSD